MKKLALVMIFSLFATLVVAAQEKPKTDAPKPATQKPDATKPEAKPADAKPAAAVPTVDEILNKYVKALGGKEALEKQTSRTVKGTFEIEAMNMSGTFEGYAKAPNKNTVIINIPGVGVVQNVFDGAKAWTNNPMMGGVQELSGELLAAQKREGDFYQPLNLKKHYPQMTVKGKEKVGAAEAYLVEAVPTEGSPEKIYFDINTGLLVRHDAEVDEGQGKMANEFYFEDYKEIDGVKIAHLVKRVNAMFTLAIKFAEIKYNTPIDDAKFNKPAGN